MSNGKNKQLRDLNAFAARVRAARSSLGFPGRPSDFELDAMFERHELYSKDQAAEQSFSRHPIIENGESQFRAVGTSYEVEAVLRESNL